MLSFFKKQLAFKNSDIGNATGGVKTFLNCHWVCVIAETS
jgi:hypothetical protein